MDIKQITEGGPWEVLWLRKKVVSIETNAYDYSASDNSANASIGGGDNDKN